MHEAVAATASCGASPAVRIAANEAWIIKSMSLPTPPHSYPPSSSSYHHHHPINTILGALDAGAHGNCAPLYTADDARISSPQQSSHPSALAASARRSLQGPSITRVPLPIPKPIPNPPTPQTAHAHTPQLAPHPQGLSHRARPRRRRPADRALSVWETTSGARSSTAACTASWSPPSRASHRAALGSGKRTGFTARLASRRAGMPKGGGFIW